MNRNNVFDDISRTLASSIPRRQAFRQILRGLAGAALVSVFGLETARAEEKKCPKGQAKCGDDCCKKGWTCCSNRVCCSADQECENKKCKKKVSRHDNTTNGI